MAIMEIKYKANGMELYTQCPESDVTTEIARIKAKGYVFMYALKKWVH